MTQLDLRREHYWTSSSSSSSLHRHHLQPTLSTPIISRRPFTIAPMPSPRRLRAASPRRPAIFDPWNSVSKGHQRADNALSGSIGWRETREAKLEAQLRGGLGGTGGARMHDLVGRGAVDDGLGWFMARDSLDEGKKQKNRRLNRKGEIGKVAMPGDAERIYLKSEKRNGAPSKDEIRAWDGRIREEKICLDVKPESEMEKRKQDGDVEEKPIKKTRHIQDCETKVLVGMTDRISNGPKEMNASKTHFFAAEDDDDIWEAEEELRPGQEQHILSNHTYSQADTVASKLTGISTPKHSRILPATSTTDYKAPISRQTTPPSGQTRYSSPSPSPPPQLRAAIEKQHTRRSNLIQQSTGSVIVQKPKTIFAGLTVHVSGPTLPVISDHALRGLLIQHGATLVMHLARRRITHVVLGRPSSSSSDGSEGLAGAGAAFAAGKMQREMHRIRSATGGPGIRFVSVEWVLESIRAGIRLSEAQFGIGMERAESPSANAPLSKEEREAVGSEVVATVQSKRLNRRVARAREMGDGRAANNAFQKGLARQSAAMPGAPPGVPSVRSLFLKQHRDNAWTKAGFVMKK